MVTDVNQTYCGDYFAICTNIESLCCTSETNIMLYVNYTSIKIITFKKQWRFHFTFSRLAIMKKTIRGGDVEKWKTSYVGWWKCKMIQLFWRTVW